MTKTETIVEHVVVTFFEAAAAYLIVIPTVNWSKTVIAGAVGAGLSAVYNVLRQSTPTVSNLESTVVEPTVPIVEIPTVPPVTPPVTEIPVVSTEPTLNQPGN